MKEPVAMNNIQANPVRLSHVPDWLRRRCLKAFGTTGGDTSGWHVLQHALRVLEREVRYDYPDHLEPPWLDHWGSVTTPDGQVWFVCEPYCQYPPDYPRMRIPHRLACAVDARVVYTPEGTWHPSTIRLTFKPNEIEP